MSIFDKKPTLKGNFVGGKKEVKSMFDAETADDEAEYDGLGVEERAERVLSEAEQAFKDRAAAEAKRFELATDSEYWFAVCFQSREQKEQFLRALAERFGLKDDGDKYLDGWELAKALGIKLDRVEVPYNTSAGKIDKRWLGLSR